MSHHNPEHIIKETKILVETDKRSDIRLNANGGNSILIVCEPSQEWDFINAIKVQFKEDLYEIIDLNELLINFIEQNKVELKETFQLLKGSVNQIFKAPTHEVGQDLFSVIMDNIENSFNKKKIPVLIHSGAIYGSGIDNIHIMEHEIVMSSSIPLVVLYPATKDGDRLLFLSKRPSSKYRCMIIN
jgi:hypothetical protein